MADALWLESSIEKLNDLGLKPGDLCRTVNPILSFVFEVDDHFRVDDINGLSSARAPIAAGETLFYLGTTTIRPVDHKTGVPLTYEDLDRRERAKHIQRNVFGEYYLFPFIPEALFPMFVYRDVKVVYLGDVNNFEKVE